MGCGLGLLARSTRKLCPDCKQARHDAYHRQPHVMERKRAYSLARYRTGVTGARECPVRIKLRRYIWAEAKARGVHRSVIQAELGIVPKNPPLRP